MQTDYTSRQAIVAAKLPALAEALGNIEPGSFWRLESTSSDYPPSILRQDGTDVAIQFLIHSPHTSSPADLYACRPHFLDDDGDCLAPAGLKINVSFSRPIQIMARDIFRRLILPLRTILPDCVSQRDARRTDRDRHQQTVNMLRRSTNHAESPCGRDHSTFHLDFNGCHLSLTVGQGGSVDMRGRYLSGEQSMAVIRALRAAQF